jgi:hypothetical protein
MWAKGVTSLAEPMEQDADLREWVYTLLLMVEEYADFSPGRRAHSGAGESS